MEPRFDVITFGECMLRCSPWPGQMLEQTDQFRIDPAGTESNMAVALARLGVRVSWFSALPDNPLGHWIAHRMETHGVDVSHLIWTDDRVGVFFLEPGSPPRGSRVVYDRAHSGASRMTPAVMDWGALSNAQIVHTSGITAALSPTCHSLVLRAMQEAKALGCLTSFDINFRSKLWMPEQAAHALAPILDHVDILISTESDIRLLFKLEGEVENLISHLVKRFGNTTVVLTLAEGGAVGWSEQTGWLRTTAHVVEQVDRLGAGDAFDAGLLYGLLQNDLSFGLACGAGLAALAYSEQGDVTWSTPRELLQLIGEKGFTFRSESQISV